MMAKKPKRAISEYQKVTPMPPQSIKRKRITAHIADRKKTRSLKNSAITKPFPAEPAEETLRQTERFLSNIFASIQDGISVLDHDMNIIRVNQTIEKWYSHAMPLVGKKCYEAYHGRKERCDVCPTHQTIHTGKGAYEVVPKVGSGGKIVGWLDLHSFPLIDTVSGKMSGVIEYVRDITERKRIEEQLINAAQQWRTTFDGISDIVCLLDREGRILKCNKAMTDLLGKPFSEIINHTHLEIVHGAPMPIEESPVERLWKTHHRETDILLINDRWFNIAVDPLLDEAGRLVGAVHIMSDVSERKQMEEALRQSEERYRTILESIQEGYFELDLAGNYTFANDANCRFLGYTKEELVGMNYRQHTDEKVAKELQGRYYELYQTGKPIESLEVEAIRKDGIKTIYETSVSLIRDPGGKPIGFRAVSRDITERKRAEEALRRSEERYRTILENIEEAYFEDDLAGDFTFVNDVLCRLLGYTRQELIGMNYRQYTDEENATKLRELYTGLYKTGKPIKAFNLEAIKKDGTKAIYETSVSLLRDWEGKPIGFRGVSREITEHKKMEVVLREREERYRTLLETMEEGYYQVDLAGNLTFLNDSFCKMHGFSKEKMLGMNNREYMSEETARKVYQIFNGVYKTGQPVRSVEWEIIRGDGGKAVVEASVYLIKNAQGERIGFRGIERDITERKRTEELLRQSEEKYRTILESIEDGYYEEDLAGNFVFFNEAMCRVYGYPKEELLGLNYKQYTDKETAKKLFQVFNDIYRTGNPSNGYSYELIRKDGAKRYIEASASLKKDSSDKPIGFRGIVRDVTERKQIEEALREREERYRTLSETMEEGYYEVDLGGNLTFVNDSFSKMHARENMLGMNNREYMSRETARRVYEIFNGVYKTGRPVRLVEWEIIKGDGQKAVVEASIYLIKNTQGERIGFRGIERDVTERKQAEEALRRSEERYRNILESIQDGYFEDDLAGNFTFMNDVICRHLGYTKEELIGMNYRQYSDEKMAEEIYRLFNGIYTTGEPVKPLEAEYTRKDGTKLIAEISPSLIRDSEGKPIGFRGISRDITERKRAEEEKRSLQEQLRQSQKMEAIGQLAGGVAHDFNNLLTVIKGYSQLSLLDLKEDNPLWGNIQEIEKATQRATDLTRQLLAFSRRQILDLKVLDLNVLLKDLDKMLRRIIGEDIELVTLLSEDLGKVKIDPSQIEQVIFNLAVNARDAMPSGGKLAIETANVELDEEYAHTHVNVAPGRYVRLSVSDTGVGMSREVKERVFEPFFTTKEKGKGTGLGLSMVYGIVKQSNGNIWLYSEPERGTTFRIYFPRTEEEADTLHEREETDFFPRGSETVLLVEDDELVRDLANRLLEQQGYRVLKAANGQEALLVAKEHVGETIHLLLADIVMPQMGGKELADWLKISRPNVKILYTSGYADNAIVHHGVLDPGTHFLQKPFSLKTLSHKVREVLDG